MNSRLLCALAGTVLLAGCGTTTAVTKPPTPLPTTPTPASVPTSVTQISSTSDPKDPYRAGRADLRAHRFDAARRHFQQAINRHKNLADSYAGLGNADLRLGKYPQSYHAYSRAASLRPREVGYVYGAAVAAYEGKRFTDAIRYATRLIHLRPGSSAGYHLRFLANDSLSRPKPQLADAHAIVRLQPRSAQAYDDLAIAYGSNRMYQQALAAFGKAISFDRKNYSLYANRAITESLIKQNAAAIADLKTARSLAPTATIKNSLSREIALLTKQSAGSTK